jgi:hypothetical protein
MGFRVAAGKNDNECKQNTPSICLPGCRGRQTAVFATECVGRITAVLTGSNNIVSEQIAKE